MPHAINHYAPSWDGHYVAFGISAGGSEDAALHVLDVRSGHRVKGEDCVFFPLFTYPNVETAVDRALEGLR